MSNFTYDIHLSDDTDVTFIHSTKKGVEIVGVSTQAVEVKLQYTDDNGSTWTSVVGVAGGSGYRDLTSATNADAPDITVNRNGLPLAVIPANTKDRQWRLAIKESTTDNWTAYKSYF